MTAQLGLQYELAQTRNRAQLKLVGVSELIFDPFGE